MNETNDRAFLLHRAITPVEWRIGEETLQGRSKQGVRGAPGIDGALEAFAHAAARSRLPALAGRLLDVSGAPALLPLWGQRAAPQGLWTVALSSAATLIAARATLAAQPAPPATELLAALPWEVAGAFDGVVWRPPADRGRRRGLAELDAVAQLLAREGVALLLQHKDEGAERMLRDAAERFAEVEILERHAGWRVAALRRPRPPAAAPVVGTEFDTPLGLQRGVVGAFAAEKLDAGSALLVGLMQGESASVRGARVLDLGSGTGVLAVAARALGAAEVLAVDDDLAAVRASAANLAALSGEGRWAVRHADLLDAEGDGLELGVDQVWCNPPFHLGRAVVHPLSAAFVAAAWSALRPGGVATFVVNRGLPYDELLRRWRSFEELTPAAERRYRLLRARR